MRQTLIDRHKLANHTHTVVLILCMAGLLGILGWFIAGAGGIKMAMIVTFLAYLFTPRMSSALIMRSLKARPLPVGAAPELYRILALLSRRAGLSRRPVLYYLPSKKLNAFAVGSPSDPAIGITHGLGASLTSREMAGILSHEITHIKNNDMQVMALSGVFGKITGYLSIVGQLMLIFSLPLVLAGQVHISLLPLALLVFAPTLSLMLHLALSRTREFEADLGSAVLLNDPHALASALSKVEQSQKGRWQRLFLPMPYAPNQAPLLQSHPPTKERIRRLLAMDPPRNPRHLGGQGRIPVH